MIYVDRTWYILSEAGSKEAWRRIKCHNSPMECQLNKNGTCLNDNDIDSSNVNANVGGAIWIEEDDGGPELSDGVFDRETLIGIRNMLSDDLAKIDAWLIEDT